MRFVVILFIELETEDYSKSCEASKRELFAKIVNGYRGRSRTAATSKMEHFMIIS